MILKTRNPFFVRKVRRSGRGWGREGSSSFFPETHTPLPRQVAQVFTCRRPPALRTPRPGTGGEKGPGRRSALRPRPWPRCPAAPGRRSSFSYDAAAPGLPPRPGAPGAALGRPGPPAWSAGNRRRRPSAPGAGGGRDRGTGSGAKGQDGRAGRRPGARGGGREGREAEPRGLERRGEPAGGG